MYTQGGREAPENHIFLGKISTILAKLYAFNENFKPRQTPPSQKPNSGYVPGRSGNVYSKKKK